MKKLKNTIVASFQAEIGRKRLRMRENKIILPFHSYPRRDRKFQKNSTKIQKIKSTIMATFQAKIDWKKAVKERK